MEGEYRTIGQWQEIYTIDELAVFLKVGPLTLRRLLASGKIECSRVGNRIRFTRQQVEDFLAGKTPPKPAEKKPAKRRKK